MKTPAAAYHLAYGIKAFVFQSKRAWFAMNANTNSETMMIEANAPLRLEISEAKSLPDRYVGCYNIELHTRPEGRQVPYRPFNSHLLECGKCPLPRNLPQSIRHEERR